MQLDIYSLDKKKNRIGFYLFHILVGLLISMGVQLLWISYFIIREHFTNGIQLIFLAILSHVFGNYLMLRGNKNKRKYICRGLVITLITVGIGLGILLFNIYLYKNFT